jgi:hypothetical protein
LPEPRHEIGAFQESPVEDEKYKSRFFIISVTQIRYLVNFFKKRTYLYRSNQLDLILFDKNFPGPLAAKPLTNSSA